MIPNIDRKVMNFSRNVRNILVVAFNRSIAAEMKIRLNSNRPLPPASAEQAATCELIKQRSCNVVSNALAGTGKTTQNEHVCRMYPGARIESKTLHGAAFGSLKKHIRDKSGVEIDLNDDKVDIIIRQILHYDNLGPERADHADSIIPPARDLVSLMKGHGFTSFRGEASDDDLRELVLKFDVDIPTEDKNGIEVTEDEVFNLARKALQSNNREVTIVDYDDMIHLALVLNVRFFFNDLILIDESQDLDPAQIELVRRMSRGDYARAQVVFVGDRNQAIYGFRGADVEAMQSIVSTFSAREMPLNTCRRCSKAVIREAQSIVPAIRALDDAPEGCVARKAESEMFAEARAGDYVLCRTTAPLVEACLGFIKQGKAANVRGRDIGTGLAKLADKISRSKIAKNVAKSLKESPSLILIETLRTYQEDGAAKLAHKSKESQLRAFNDRMACLLVMAEECKDFDELAARIRAIFANIEPDNQSDQIVLSTVHRAKGLEAETTWVIHPELLPGPWARQEWQIVQEMNLKYVAITRAKKNLYWVDPGQEDQGPKNGPGVPQDGPSGRDVPPIDPVANRPQDGTVAVRKAEANTGAKKPREKAKKIARKGVLKTK